jgi:zinc protease
MKKGMMKNLFLVAMLGIALPGRAQEKTPVTTREISVGGLKIILKKVPKEVVTTSFFIRGGVANITDSTQGIEAMAINLVLRGGTKTMDKNQFSTQAEKLGSRFSSNVSKDYSTITMNCLPENWDPSWGMFTDAILNPAMDTNEFKVIKQQMIATARQQESNPDAYLRKLATEQIFHGTPYARIQTGTPETLEKLSIGDVIQYYSRIPGKKNCYLVVVGQVDEKDLIEKVRRTLSRLPEGSMPPKAETAGVQKEDINVKDRSIATNYILGTLNGPRYFSADGPLFEFAMSILSERYFVELRTKRSLSYAPAASYNKSFIDNPLVELYISTTDPKTSMEVMTEIIEDVRKNGFTAKEVENKKKQYLTRYYITNESTNAQANSLGLCEASGSWRIFDEVNQRIDQVKPEDVNKVFGKYMTKIAWTYLGKKDKVVDADFKQLSPAPGKLPPSKLSEVKKG